MKNHFLKAIIIIAIILSSCSKDDERTYTEENFLADFLTTSQFSGTTDSTIDGGNYEFGIEFTPLVKGKITALKVKIPDVNNAVRVTIWDKVSTTVMRSETLNITSANSEQSIDIADLQLEANHQYAITMNSNDWYNHRRADNSDVSYPITSGNIQIDNYKWVSGTAQTYPTNISTSYFAGDVSFNFIQMN